MRAVAAIAVLIGLSVPSATAGSTAWIVTELETLGGTYGDANDINDRGQVVGSAETVGGNRHATLWQAGRVIDLGTLGGEHSAAYAISDNGVIVGESEGRAFVWRRGTMISVAPPGTGSSEATDINGRGEIIGSGSALGTRRRLMFHWWKGRFTTIARLRTIQPVAINGRGQAVGEWKPTPATWRGFVWSDGERVDLGTLGGEVTRPMAINERGQVVGFSETPGGDRHAFLWQKGRMRDLGTLGGTFSIATGINDSGVIVGSTGDRAFRWRHGRMEDLGVVDHEDVLIASDGTIVFRKSDGEPYVFERGQARKLPGGYYFASAHALNSRGQIIGSAHAGRATPVLRVLWERKR